VLTGADRRDRGRAATPVVALCRAVVSCCSAATTPAGHAEALRAAGALPGPGP
jgi:hypothetical protein